ncbi:MAG: hypothetical protein IKB02_05805 [Clostridia bacterium]|nr:hypothetical protein [Clostridia bacterium]
MKAWLVKDKDECAATVVFAETRGKARSMAMATDACEDVAFCDIEVRRVPSIDKYYKEGKKEMDWYDDKDRLALVKECSFRCEYMEIDLCEDCPAKEYCDEYQDYIAELEESEGGE